GSTSWELPSVRAHDRSLGAPPPHCSRCYAPPSSPSSAQRAMTSPASRLAPPSLLARSSLAPRHSPSRRGRESRRLGRGGASLRRREAGEAGRDAGRVGSPPRLLPLASPPLAQVPARQRVRPIDGG